MGNRDLAADLYQAGFAAEAWKVWERILWWPEHLAVYPQGIANDDYTSRFPQSKPFGGRISAGRTNEISGCVGVEAIVRGLFAVRPGKGWVHRIFRRPAGTKTDLWPLPIPFGARLGQLPSVARASMCYAMTVSALRYFGTTARYGFTSLPEGGHPCRSALGGAWKAECHQRRPEVAHRTSLPARRLCRGTYTAAW